MASHVDRELRRNIACDKYDFVTVSKDSLRTHDATHHYPKLKVETAYECSVCLEHFETYNQLYRHNTGVHRVEKKPFVCSYCGKCLKGAPALKNHISLYHSEGKSGMPCPIEGCAKVCLTTKQLKNHIKTHDDDTKEICPECGLLVANKHNLEKHINRIHLKLRNYACDLCEYRGFFKFNILEHVS